METHTIFLMIYFLAFQFPDLNAFHLDEVKKINGENLKILHSPYRESSTESTSSSFNALMEKKPLSSIKTNAEVLNNDKTKVHDKAWTTTAKTAVLEKSLNLLSTPSHPKRQINHPTWRKISKEPHIFSTVDNSRQKGFNGFDVVVVDIPSSYSRMRWDKPPFVSPSFRYAPMTRSPSIFDFLLGLDSISENVLSEPAGLGNEVYFQQSLDAPTWNRHLSFGGLTNPAKQKLMNGNRFPKDVSAIPYVGKLTEPAKNCTCVCEERKKFP